MFAASPAALAFSVRVAGVVPLEGATVSQAALVDATVKLVAVAALNWTVCAGGAALPSVCANCTEVGVAVIAPVEPPPLTIYVTKIYWGLVFACP